MKISINQWAFPGDMPAVDALSLAHKMGFEAFEICVGEKGPFPLDATEADAKAVRKHADSLGIELCSVGSGMGWSLPMTSPDAGVREQGKEATAKALQVAQWLGAGSVLVVPGSVTPDTPYDVALENALASIQDLVSTAEKLRVSVAVENVWNKFLLSPVEMRDFIDQFESEYVGAYFDTGNIIAYWYPEQWIRILGERIKAIHAKDFRASVGTLGGFVMLMEGDVDWPAVVGALRDVGFNGALTAEFGPYNHSLEVMLEHVVAGLKAIVTL